MNADVFISHASEDKDAVAKPIAEELRRRGYRVWYDEFVLQIGDSLSEQIDLGLSRCRFGLVILSHNFFSKRWPKRELEGLTSREVAGERKIILPVWHEISHAEILKHSPTLANKVAVSTSDGLDKVVEKIEAVLVRNLDKPLIQAVNRGDLAEVSRLLVNGANPDCVDEEGNTPLHVASYKGHVEIAQLLLDNNASVDAENIDRWTPLHSACFRGYLELVRVLLRSGANVNADRHVTGMRPYDNAMSRGHDEIAKLLREHGGRSRWEDGPPIDISKLMPPFLKG